MLPRSKKNYFVRGIYQSSFEIYHINCIEFCERLFIIENMIDDSDYRSNKQNKYKNLKCMQICVTVHWNLCNFVLIFMFFNWNTVNIRITWHEKLLTLYLFIWLLCQRFPVGCTIGNSEDMHNMDWILINFKVLSTWFIPFVCFMQNLPKFQSI